MATRIRHLYLVLGEPSTGLWCERCALPSLIVVPVYTLSEYGVRSGSTITRCLTPECSG